MSKVRGKATASSLGEISTDYDSFENDVIGDDEAGEFDEYDDSVDTKKKRKTEESKDKTPAYMLFDFRK
jgi:hypothetical protein